MKQTPDQLARREQWWTPDRIAVAAVWLALTTSVGLYGLYGMLFGLLSRWPHWPTARKGVLIAGAAFGSGYLLVWYLRRRKAWLIAALVFYGAALAAAIFFSLQPLGYPFENTG